MSEERFIFATNEKWFLFDNETEDYLDMEDCKDKLNEQQVTIEQLKEGIEPLKQKECFKIKDIPIEKKKCGYCKHFQLDGMFGFWCDKNHNWRVVNENCSDFER